MHLDGGEIVIGAMTTQHEIIASELLAQHAPILRETAEVIADPQVRYIGTIGGNVANGDPGNDMPALMMTLGANYVLQGASGERRVAARDYYLSTYETAAEPGEVLAAIRVPPSSRRSWLGVREAEAQGRRLCNRRRRGDPDCLGWGDRDLRGRPHQRCRNGAVRCRLSGLGHWDRTRQADPRASHGHRNSSHGARRRRTRFGGISRQNGRRHDRARAHSRLRARKILKGPTCLSPMSADGQRQINVRRR